MKTPRSLPALRASLFYLAVLLVAACGGDGGSPAALPAVLSAQPTVNPTAGIWSSQTLTRCRSALGIITEDGSIHMETPIGVFVGSIASEPPFAVQAVNYVRSAGIPLARVARPNDGVLTIESAEQKSSLHVAWRSFVGGLCAGAVEQVLAYVSTYERSASLATVAGVYSDQSNTLSLSVNSDGILSGSDTNGCVLNGTFAVARSDRSYYLASVDVDNCAAAGRYAGVAFLLDANGGRNNELVLSVANAEHAIWQQLFASNAIVVPATDTDEKSVCVLGHLADGAHA